MAGRRFVPIREGQVLPSAKRRDACTKDGSRLSFSAISSGKYFSSSIARTSDSPRAKRKVPLAPTQGRRAAPGFRAAPPPPRREDLRASSLAHAPCTCDSSRPAARPSAHTCPSLPSSLARAESQLTQAALTGEAGTGRVPPLPNSYWCGCHGRRGPRAGCGLSLGRAARRIA